MVRFHHIYYLTLFMLLLFTGCVREGDGVPSVSRGLGVSFRFADSSSRALVNALTGGHKVGLGVVDATGSGYDGSSFHNVMATAELSGSSLVWGLEPAVKLNATLGTVYAYYPYSASVSDITAVPVESVSQTDYMYGTPVSGVSAASPDADILLNHALAAVRVKIQRGTYAGTGVVSAVSVCGEGIAASALLDATSGTLTGFSGVGAEVSAVCGGGVTVDGGETDVIFVPVSGCTDIYEVSLVVDGVSYSCTADACSFEQGSVYVCTVTLDTSGLSLSDMSFGDWGYSTTGYPVISIDGKKITFSGNIENIAFNNRVNDDGSVTITAVPMLEGQWVAAATLSGDENPVFEQSVDIASGVRSITLSAVSTDLDLYFAGLHWPVYVTGDKNYMDWSVKKDVTDNSVVVTVSPQDDGDWVNDISGSGDAVMMQSFDDITGVRTVTLQQQNGPYTVNLNGIGSADWHIATYNVTEPGEVEIFSTYSDVNGNKYVHLNQFSIRVDGKSISPSSYYYNFDSPGLHSIKFSCNETGQDYIANHLFCYVTSLVSVQLNHRTRSIMTTAFSGCRNLTHIKIPASCISIGEGAFEYCYGLQTLELNEGLQSIGCKAFYQCTALSGVLRIPDSVTSLDDGVWYTKYGAFQGCTGLTGISIGSGLSHIPDYTFKDCVNLQSLVLPNTVLSIGYETFYGCASLSHCDLGSGLQTIGSFAFENCTSISSIRIPDSCLSIGERAFQGCSSLSTLDLGCGIESIDRNAFWYTPLTGTLVIPDACHTISNEAFCNCTGLTALELGTGLQTIGDYAFYGCKGIVAINSLPMCAPSIGSYTFYNVKSGGTLTVPDGATGYDVWMQTSSYYLGYYGWAVQ